MGFPTIPPSRSIPLVVFAVQAQLGEAKQAARLRGSALQRPAVCDAHTERARCLARMRVRSWRQGRRPPTMEQLRALRVSQCARARANAAMCGGGRGHTRIWT